MRVPTILLVDDEPAITENLAPLLQRAGFEVVVAQNGDDALRRVRRRAGPRRARRPAAPGMDGRAVLRQVRLERREVPIILLTQVGESGERAMALEEGADDYLNKPFDPYELVARIRAVLRRGRTTGRRWPRAQRLRSGAVTLDRASQRVFRNGTEVLLTPRATVLLAYLMTHPDEVMTPGAAAGGGLGLVLPGRASARWTPGSPSCGGCWRKLRHPRS